MSSFTRHRPAQSSIASVGPNKLTQQSLAKRLLFHSHPTDELPPLFISETLPPELTAEVYDFIALALRAYINPWWTKITRYDKEFLPQVTHILVIVIRALELRIQRLDFPALVFHDIPTILSQHYADYRNALSKLSTSYASGGAASLPQLFSQMQPHTAILPDGKIDPEYFRQVFDYILRVCLPLEDHEAEAERIIVREVIIKVLLDDVLPKVTQPWFIQKTILDLLGPSAEEEYMGPLSAPPSSFSFHNLLIIILSVLQSFSGACIALIHAYKQAIITIKLVQHSPPYRSSTLPPQTGHTVPPSTSPVADQSHKFVPPPSISPTASTSSSTSSYRPQQSASISAESLTITQVGGNYAAPGLAMVSEVFSTRDRFSSNIFHMMLTMLSISITSFLDKLLPYLLLNTLSPAFILNITRLSKRTLFPNGYPGPQPQEPTLEEQAEIRAKLVAWRGKGVLSYFLPLILGPRPSDTLGAVVDPLSSAQCNTHLLVLILDTVLMGLFPELADGLGKSE